MRCPECKAVNQADAAACESCGLLLIAAAAPPSDLISVVAEPPKRRAEDLAVRRRRAGDETTQCQFCNGTVVSKAIRCKHCSEVLDEDFYRERAQRLRARMNYASWVMYLFGLGALLVFRP